MVRLTKAAKGKGSVAGELAPINQIICDKTKLALLQVMECMKAWFSVTIIWNGTNKHYNTRF